MSLPEITDKLGLNQLNEFTWNIFPICATKGDGVVEALEWFSNVLALRETTAGLNNWLDDLFGMGGLIACVHCLILPLFIAVRLIMINLKRLTPKTNRPSEKRS